MVFFSKKMVQSLLVRLLTGIDWSNKILLECWSFASLLFMNCSRPSQFLHANTVPSDLVWNDGIKKIYAAFLQ